MAVLEPSDDNNNNFEPSKLDKEIEITESDIRNLSPEAQFEYYKIKSTIEKLNKEQAQKVALKFLGLYIKQRNLVKQIIKGN